VYEAKLQPLLKSDNVLRADRIRTPQSFVEVFPIPATKFGGTVIDVIKWTTPFEYAFELPKFADVTTRIEWYFYVGTQAEADFVWLVLQITGDDVMTAIAELGNQAGTNSPEAARD
jgi:hypothetical protein